MSRNAIENKSICKRFKNIKRNKFNLKIKLNQRIWMKWKEKLIKKIKNNREEILIQT
jgi:hypothetical protein